jgi:hypothetical protein
VRSPTVNRHLPWEAIRRDWETTAINMVALAHKYGVASTTTLTRRRGAESWKRGADVCETQPGADDGDFQNRQATSGGQSAAAPRTSADRSADRTEPPPSKPRDGSAPVDPTVAHGRDTALSPTQNHFGRAAALGIQVQETASLVLERVRGVLRPPSGDAAADEAVIQANLQQLIRVNPERETLAGLLTAGTKAVDLGVTMERRALAAEVASKPAPGSLGTPAGSGSNLAREILQGMDPETVERMRAWALEVQRKQREAQITAAKAGSA